MRRWNFEVKTSAKHILLEDDALLNVSDLRAHALLFQGSLDGKNWTILREHENDETLCKPGQFASWPIIDPNALLPFRFFRVVLTGSTTDEANPWSCCICFLELYGYFR